MYVHFSYITVYFPCGRFSIFSICLGSSAWYVQTVYHQCEHTLVTNASLGGMSHPLLPLSLFPRFWGVRHIYLIFKMLLMGGHIYMYFIFHLYITMIINICWNSEDRSHTASRWKSYIWTKVYLLYFFFFFWFSCRYRIFSYCSFLSCNFNCIV